jgi:conjugal transfer mating pair stabilization protein TraN
VNKVLTCIGLLWCMGLAAQPQTSLTPTDAFKESLEHFKPGDFVSGFTNTPPQAALNPNENHDVLKAQGMDAMRQNEAASQVYLNEKTRTKVFENPDSAYLQYSERLIDSSEWEVRGGCIAQPPICTTNSSIEHCEDRVVYIPTTCQDTLQVSVNKPVHFTRRYVDRKAPMDLAHCAGRSACTQAQEVHVSPGCQTVVVETKYNGYVVGTNHDQTCTNLMLSINFKSYPHPGHSVTYDITVTESIIEDRWDKSSCMAIAQKGNACIFQNANSCIDANATKMINGIPVTRPCWGARYQYQCFSHRESTCTPWINQGCTQIMSTCVKLDFGVCLEFSQTFECARTTCTPVPDVCRPALPCTDGSCDTTQNEESHDLAEGASRLGALAGVASDVSTKQINTGVANIFSGSSMQCEKFPLGSRDCCTDSGWGDWVLHCPKEMQDLQKAKAEDRVVFVGEYDDWILDSVRHYVYCIFPSKLSSIIQIQGRGAQLHIPYGTPETPNCRGITPEELERIAFDQLNLSSVEKEFMSRLNPPDLGRVTNTNQAHIERLNQLRKPYD